MEILIGLGVIALIAFIIAVSMYNSLVRLRNQVKNALAQIDVQLKRRHDLIPNLIEAVKSYMKHEKETLEDIVKLRQSAMNAQTVGEKAKAEGALSGLLDKIFVVVENYPDLKANQNFLNLQEELSSTENKLSFARQSFNDQVLFYNNKIQIFPSSIIAGMFNFKEEEFFEVPESDKEVPKVQF